MICMAIESILSFVLGGLWLYGTSYQNYGQKPPKVPTASKIHHAVECMLSHLFTDSMAAVTLSPIRASSS